MIPADIALVLKKVVVLCWNTSLVERCETKPTTEAVQEDSGKDRVSVEGGALLGQLFQKFGAPLNSGLVRAAKDMFVVLGWAAAQRTPIRVARMVPVNELASGKHVMAQLHVMGTSEGVIGCQTMGVPIDTIRNVREPTIMTDEAVEKGLSVCCVPDGRFEISMNGFPGNVQRNRTGRGQWDQGSIHPEILLILARMFIGIHIQLGKEG